MHRRFSQQLFIITVTSGLWLFGGTATSWSQIILTCAVKQGCSNTIASGSDYATISGGKSNSTSSDYTTVGGGLHNTASGYASTVGGGVSGIASGQYSTVGGGAGNKAGGVRATASGGSNNSALGNYASVGGGILNVANGSDSATISGGRQNDATGEYSTIGGGSINAAAAKWATVSGGGENDATGERSVVSGGYKNLAGGPRATVGGGYLNTASGFGATVPGGGANAALGNYSWAGGLHAKAWHKGAFVWADTTAANFPSTAANQFNVRAQGGTRIFTNGAATVGVRLLPGSNAWSIASDRALKEDFQSVDKQQILANVQRLPITNWKLKDEAGNVRHVGPVAQDFHAAFQLGGDERYLHSGDVDGIALVAIQALAEQNQTLKQHLKELQRQNANLQRQMDQVRQEVQTLVRTQQERSAQQVASVK